MIDAIRKAQRATRRRRNAKEYEAKLSGYELFHAGVLVHWCEFTAGALNPADEEVEEFPDSFVRPAQMELNEFAEIIEVKPVIVSFPTIRTSYKKLPTILIQTSRHHLLVVWPTTFFSPNVGS